MLHECIWGNPTEKLGGKLTEKMGRPLGRLQFRTLSGERNEIFQGREKDLTIFQRLFKNLALF